ncbi:arylformamidase [Marinobacterium sp. D7]|uniref:arylformamidase n=1 Tax=Marinobacterium ramblicola TaxID=2849041 RepID=UPI001C2DE58C|nr:arylformamidase [Marinobacterium ramblicola]MBV1789105.1 arylformamidase [Marinobacterium ramblicola]
MSRIWDISQTLRPGLPVWPGDTAYLAEPTWVLEEGCPVNVGRVQLSTHSGTHADAPLHYDANGESIAEVALEVYLGPCVLIDAVSAKGRVQPEDIVDQLPERVERVLLRTYPSFPHHRWVDDFTAVAADTIELLAERGARLIGIDSPSLDPQSSKTLDAHRAVRRHRMAILEGLVLDRVPAGHYELIAPPLKLDTLDASPVRALLRSIHP